VHEYWNHNTAYHDWILSRVASDDVVLDVGCGDGLLLTRLAAVAGEAVGCDPSTARIAETNTSGLTNVSVVNAEFGLVELADESFDAITFVASLHHMDCETALRKARRLLRPGGRLLVVGLVRNQTAVDWTLAGLSVVPVRIASFAHREVPEPGSPITAPKDSLARVRAIADSVLPGASIRRAFYYRYLLEWEKPR